MKLEGCVCLASRGLVHSRTMEAIWRNLAHKWDYWEIVFSHDRPIPEAQLYVTYKALLSNAKWLWYIEEDMVPEDGTLYRMLASGADAIMVDYNLAHGTRAVNRSKEFPYGGMGCLLVRANVFDRLEKPWFATKAFSGEGYPLGFDLNYGGQDVFFHRRLAAAGIEVAVIDSPCAHLRLKNPGSLMTNRGVHEIVEL